MDDKDQKKQIENLYTKKKFPFTYYGIINNNSNLSYNIKKFWQD